jgi:hypothetical protein
MARIWFLKEGAQQRGEAQTEKSLDWCVKELGLQKSHWDESLQQRPLIIGQPSQLSAVREYRFVVVTLDESDVSGEAAEGWKPGACLIDMTPDEVRPILIGC